MPKPIIIANWKMNLSFEAALALAREFKKQFGRLASPDLAVCPDFLSLPAVGEELQNSVWRLGGQDVFWQLTGAYTGEISAPLLKKAGADFALVGHSERRQHLGETDELVNLKVNACLTAGLTPIICVGESLDERQEDLTNTVILRQTMRALAGIDVVPNEQVIIAYEPVWAIGAGQAVEPEEADEVFKLIRQTLIDLYPLSLVNQNFRLIYGGSVNEDNAEALAATNLGNGFLVGGASLSAEKFGRLIAAFKL